MQQLETSKNRKYKRHNGNHFNDQPFAETVTPPTINKAIRIKSRMLKAL